MKKIGRPPKITDKNGKSFAKEYLNKLEDAFKKGMNNSEACLSANISERVFYSVVKKNEKLKDHLELLQKNVNMIAKQNIVDQIIKKKDIELSKWWSERKNKDEFSVRNEQTGKDGKDLPVAVVTGFNYIKPKKDEGDNKRDNTNDKSTT